MNKNQNEGAGNKIAGNAKKAAGKITGDRKLEAEGQVQKTTGSVQKKVGDVQKSADKR